MMTDLNRARRNEPRFQPPLRSTPAGLRRIWNEGSWRARGMLVVAGGGTTMAALATVLPLQIAWEYPASALVISLFPFAGAIHIQQFRARFRVREERFKVVHSQVRFSARVVSTLLALIVFCIGAWVWITATQFSMGDPSPLAGGIGEQRITGILGGANIAVLAFGHGLLAYRTQKTL